MNIYRLITERERERERPHWLTGRPAVGLLTVKTRLVTGGGRRWLVWAWSALHQSDHIRPTVLGLQLRFVHHNLEFRPAETRKPSQTHHQPPLHWSFCPSVFPNIVLTNFITFLKSYSYLCNLRTCECMSSCLEKRLLSDYRHLVALVILIVTSLYILNIT